jgi:hypothetical protein
LPLRVFRGHFGALEPSFASTVTELRDRGRLAVVTSGRAQMERLQEILLETMEPLTGVEFFPGFPQLAKRLVPFASGSPEAPGALDRIFMVMEAARGLEPGIPFSDVGDNPRAALSLAGFLEDLLEKGADAEAYSVILKTLPREPGATEAALGKVLEAYEFLRKDLYPSAPDRLVASAVSSGRFDRFAAYLFYGIYDLNPLQRRLAKKLVSIPGTDIRWFTPLTPGPAGKLDIAGRTTEILDKGMEMRRQDAGIRQAAFGVFGENLVASKTGRVPESGFEYVLAHGPSGAARAALREVAGAVARGIPLSRVAVIGRKSLTVPIARQARAEGIDLYRSPEVSLSALPAGCMARAALEALEHESHHMYLRAVPATGALREDCSPDAKEIDAAILETGPRNGVREMRDAVAGLARFPRLGKLLRRLGALEDLLAEHVSPSSCLPRILDALVGMADEAPAKVLSSARARLGSLWNGKVPRRAFIQSVILALEDARARIGNSRKSGLRLLDFEDARGLEFDTVVVVGLEEGVIPASGFDDPRLSADLRAGLEIPSAPTREREEAFLLALACGSAINRLVFVQRVTDERGDAVQHSPLVDPILDEAGEAAAQPPAPVTATGERRTRPPGWLRRQKADPFRILFEGDDPGQRAVMEASEGRITPFLPFLAESLEAWAERRWSEKLGAYDGILSPEASSAIRPGDLSPTFLGAWGNCPFRCLVEKAWRLEEPSDVGVSLSPDPLSRGDFLHKVIEEVVTRNLEATEAEVAGIIRSMEGFSALEARLGSRALREAFARDTAGLVLSFAAMLREHGTAVVDTEKGLAIDVGGYNLSGRADLLLSTPSGLCVVDIKTSRNVPGRSELLRRFTGGRDYQIPLYCAALEKAGRAVSSAGYFYCAAVPRAHVFEGEELREIVASALENAPRAAALIRRGMFFPVPGEGCERCRWKALCRHSDYSSGRIERLIEADGDLSWLHSGRRDGEGAP